MSTNKVKQLFIILNLSLLCSACQDRAAHYQTQILGEWQSADQSNMIAYRFDADETCRKMPGFFEYIDSTQPTVENPYTLSGSHELDITAVIHNIIRYYRSHSCYKIENNCLKIYDPAIKEWDTHYLSFKADGTLVLSDKERIKQTEFVRKHAIHEENDPLFEQILIYYPPTNFNCGKYYSFEQNGQLVASERLDKSDSERTYTNYLWATIDKDDYKKLDHFFKQADIEKYIGVLQIEEGYNMFLPDKPAILFVRDNKMYTFNNDFSRIPSANFKAFYQACFSAFYFIDNLLFQPEEVAHREDLLYNFHSSGLRRLYMGDKEIWLSDLDYFYLMTLIRRAPETTETFQLVYTIKDSKINETILTDGRFFSYWVPAGERTVDIGFNFMDEYITLKTQ